MPLISGTIPSMLGGVSQQDASIRQPNQLEEALNCNLSAARGAGGRPPARFIGVLGSDIPDNAFFHSIIRDSRERYIVVVYGGRVRVFNHLTGYEYVVVGNNSDGYLTTSQEPWQDLRACTVDDTTFLLNRSKTVGMTGSKAPGTVSGTAQTFQDLPKDASANAIYEVQGDANSSFDNYYVQRQSSSVWKEVARPGAANELDKATMPHVLKRIPDGTNPDGFYFAWGPQDWDLRYSGDEQTCPTPSIVGTRLGDVSFHRDRLVLAGGGGNIVLSEVGQYFNFWRTTITSLLDSDPIDVMVPTEGVAELLHLQSYLSALLIFATGNTSLFQLTGQQLLSPKTVKIDPVLNYQAHPTIKPQLAGTSLFFIDDSSYKSWTTVREYFVSDEEVTPDAAEITAHVPAYVPGNTRCMASAPDADLLFLAHQSPSGPQVFVHQFRWAGDQKQQSAWHPWKIEQVGAVVHMHAIGTDLYLVAKSPGGGVELLTMDLGQHPVMSEVSPDFDVLLDRRELVTPSYQAFGNYTDLTVPFVLPTLSGLVALKTTDWSSPGTVLDLRGATLVNGGQTLRIPGNQSTGRLVIGYKYTRRATLSQQFLRGQNGDAQIVGRLQLRRMTVRYTDSTYFQCLVYPKGRPEAIDTLVPQLTNTFTSRTVGDSAFLLDTPAVASGSHTFLVASRAENVNVAFSTDSPFPAWFQSVQWEGTYTTKVRM